MKLSHKGLKNIFIITSRQRKLILTVFWLSIYRNLLLVVKSKKAFSEHISKNQEINASVLTLEKTAIAKDITLAILIGNKLIPWKNVCRHQSWQAIILLLKYKIPYEYSVGVEKNKPKNEAHSWVRVNNRFICGRCDLAKYFILYKKSLK